MVALPRRANGAPLRRGRPRSRLVARGAGSEHTRLNRVSGNGVSGEPDAPADDHAALRLRASRTLRTSPSGVNGFSRNTSLGARIDCRFTASAV
jgi:hypothetical protein